MATTTAAPDVPVKRRRLTLSTQVLIGLAAGVAVGLFIGERAQAFDPWADAYIKLLQMTVLPYVTLSLVGGIGGLRADEAKRLGIKFAGLLLGLWGIALLAVFVFPLMFPSIQSASFFSSTLLEKGQPLDLVSLYIPANPFNSLANNVVPAVVLFSTLLGVALIAIPEKAAALDLIGVINRAVGRVAHFIVALTPYGLFAIAAVIAGTFDPVQAMRLQIYLVAYIVMALLLSFWVLPGLIAAVTPIPHRAVLAHTRDALIMAFTTGSLFVVLPLLTEQTRSLLREYVTLPPHDESLPDVIIPASFNFPHTAKLMSLSFIVFAAWFSGSALAAHDYPLLGGTGILVLFGNLNVAVPFLLDLFRIPADTFQLFLATSVVNSRFGTMLSAVHTIAMALIGTCAVIGVARFDARRLLRFGLITVVLGAAAIGGTRAFVSGMAAQPYDKDKVISGMRPLRDRGPAEILPSPAPALPPFTGSVLDRIHARGAVRVGYFDDSLPYVFRNSHGELVGFDVEMAHQLARDLGFSLELVHLERASVANGVDPSLCDVVMSGTVVTADRAMHSLYSAPYLDETLALLIFDHRRSEFASWDDIRAMRHLTVAVPRAAYYIERVREQIPEAVIVPFDSTEPMFQAHTPPFDALVLTAERGSAYTLLHPEYSVVVPQPDVLKVPLAYIVAGRDTALATMLNAWIDLKRKDGTIDQLFGHWILGRDATAHHRRWSILDDVLNRR